MQIFVILFLECEVNTILHKLRENEQKTPITRRKLLEFLLKFVLQN